jgi:hypothetical protein
MKREHKAITTKGVSIGGGWWELTASALDDDRKPPFLARVYANSWLMVMCYERFGVEYVGLRRHDRKEFQSPWSVVQEIKERFFAGRCAVEFYPAQDDLVDDAPMRWLWMLPDDARLGALGLGWARGGGSLM